MSSLKGRTTSQYGTLVPELRKRDPNVWTYRFSEPNNDTGKAKSGTLTGTALDDSGQPQAGLMTTSHAIYFLSSLASLVSFASAIRACWPASATAFRNAAALLGVVALPERMLRNIMCLP